MIRDVFLSYKTEDREAAERLCSALEREDISCWMAPRDIPPGHEWAAAIVDGLQKSKSFVLLLSSHSVAAKQIAREAELADNQNLKILTFRLEDIQPPRELLYFLGNIQWLDAFGGQFDSAAARLAQAIRNLPSGPQPLQQPANRPPPPTSPPPAADKRNTYLWPSIAGAVVLIAAGLWFAFSGHPKPVPTDEAQRQAVKAFVEQYLEDRDSGQYSAAWNSYSEAFKSRVKEPVWQNETDKRNREHGGIAKHEYRDCKANGEDAYICQFSLIFNDGVRFRNDLRVVKNSSGKWSIDTGKIIEPKSP